MDAVPEILRMFFALGIVILLMLLIAYGMRRYPFMQKFMGAAGQAPRLKVISSLMLDVRHRLVIVRIDDKEKTFLLSPESAQEVSQ